MKYNLPDPLKKSAKQLSVDEMNKILLENVPSKERMDAVYIPMVTQDCACYLCEEIITLLRLLKRSDTRKACRELAYCIVNYRKDNSSAMPFELYQDMKEKSEEIYKWLNTDTFLYVLQYTNELYTKGFSHLSREELNVLSQVYVAKQILTYVIHLDREFSERISSFLPLEVHYHTDDNEYAVRMTKALTEVISAFGAPDTLDSMNIQLSYKIFQNRISQCHIGYTEVQLTEKEQARYDKGWCRCTDCEWFPLMKECRCAKASRVIREEYLKIWRKCKFFKM